MKIALTGATGLVGSNIAAHLADNGHDINAIHRKTSDLSALSHIRRDRLSLTDADLLDVVQLDQAFKGADMVIHCAAVVSFNPKDEEKMMMTNVQGTANVVNACLSNNIERLVHISSVAALGRGTEKTVTEKSQWKPGPLNTAYARSKHLAELEVWRGEAEGLSAVILNPSVILGAGDLENSSTRLFNYILKGAKLYPEGSVNFVDLRDVVEAVSTAVRDGSIKGRFILNSGSVPYIELFTQMAKHLKVKAPNIKVPNSLTSALWPLEQIRSYFTGKAPLITRETAMLSRQHYIYDSSLAQNRLGISFRPLHDTLPYVCGEILERNNR